MLTNCFQIVICTAFFLTSYFQLRLVCYLPLTNLGLNMGLVTGTQNCLLLLTGWLKQDFRMIPIKRAQPLHMYLPDFQHLRRNSLNKKFFVHVFMQNKIKDVLNIDNSRFMYFILTICLQFVFSFLIFTKLQYTGIWCIPCIGKTETVEGEKLICL